MTSYAGLFRLFFVFSGDYPPPEICDASPVACFPLLRLKKALFLRLLLSIFLRALNAKPRQLGSPERVFFFVGLAHFVMRAGLQASEVNSSSSTISLEEILVNFSPRLCEGWRYLRDFSPSLLNASFLICSAFSLPAWTIVGLFLFFFLTRVADQETCLFNISLCLLLLSFLAIGLVVFLLWFLTLVVERSPASSSHQRLTRTIPLF